jgi:hypothetical protein
MKVGPVDGTTAVPKIRIQLRILLDFIWSFVGREMDMFAIETTN